MLESEGASKLLDNEHTGVGGENRPTSGAIWCRWQGYGTTYS